MKQDLEHMDPLLLRLRQQLEPTETDIGLPSPGVWHAIQAANERRRKRRRLTFCLLFAAITIGGFAMYDLRLTNGSGLTNDDLRLTNGASGLASVPNAALKSGVQLPEAPASLKKLKSDLRNPTSDLQNPKLAHFPTAAKNPKPEIRNPKSKAGGFTMYDVRVTNDTPGLASKPASGLVEVPSANPNIEPTPKSILPETTTSDFRNPTSEIRNPKSDLPNLISEIRNPTSEIQTVLVPSLVMGQIKAYKLPKPLTFALRSGVLWTMLRTHGKDVATVSSKKERSAWTWQHGLAIGQRLNKHWYWETGLQHTGHRLHATREVQLTFRSKQERFNPVAQIYTGTVQQDLATAFGEVEMRYDINRVAGKPVRDQTPVKASFETDELVRYWRLPVALGYETRIKAFGWGLYGGVGANFLSGHRFDIVNTGTDIPAIRSIDARMIKQADELTKVMVDMHLGGDIYWWISRHCRLNIGLEGRQGLQSMYGSTEGGRTVPLALWPHIGIGIR